ncbi:helix-turn-helix domain-containing protein [Rhodococcus sp. H29-C3]|uniref:TetR/AcrR family transcriptional regulator n=1 Tax=Rhodococcus sp. H29-C3 TaxID=3046307 RepID=UPI0024BB5E60|nr:helix-turn-helix domain-containing protein [Rhodococcus sp. H29-C3]MDJ0363260.1 helix-turn-helix domain-containing protein [Rhodococcus sp. H29-C3]
MGRPRRFESSRVVAAAAVLFDSDGYEGSSMDRLVQVTGVHRGSLYATFGSKRGLFLACLRVAVTSTAPSGSGLLLVALGELASRDEEVRAICAEAIDAWGDQAAHELGRRLLARAGLMKGNE